MTVVFPPIGSHRKNYRLVGVVASIDYGIVWVRIGLDYFRCSPNALEAVTLRSVK